MNKLNSNRQPSDTRKDIKIRSKTTNRIYIPGIQQQNQVLIAGIQDLDLDKIPPLLTKSPPDINESQQKSLIISPSKIQFANTRRVIESSTQNEKLDLGIKLDVNEIKQPEIRKIRPKDQITLIRQKESLEQMAVNKSESLDIPISGKSRQSNKYFQQSQPNQTQTNFKLAINEQQRNVNNLSTFANKNGYGVKVEMIEGHPQQNIFRFENSSILISSNFDSGNLAFCNRYDRSIFSLGMCTDSQPFKQDGQYRTWFHFRVTGVPQGDSLTFNIKQMNHQSKLFANGMKPVYKVQNQMRQYRRIAGDLTYNDILDQGEKLNRQFRASSEIYFHKELVGLSLEGRQMEMYTITIHSFVFTKIQFQDLIDLIEKLFSQALEYILVKSLLLMYQMGQQTLFFRNPNLHPTIFVAKQLILQQHKLGNLKFYIDLHAHAVKKGCFIFGNNLQNHEDQLLNQIYPKLISMNSLNFDFVECSFNEKLMNAKDKNYDGGLSREGCARVSIYQETKLVHCYTLECNYQTGRRVNHIAPKIDLRTNQKLADPPTPNYTQEIFEDVGVSVCVAFLDYKEINPISRIRQSAHKNLDVIYFSKHIRGLKKNSYPLYQGTKSSTIRLGGNKLPIEQKTYNILQQTPKTIESQNEQQPVMSQPQLNWGREEIQTTQNNDFILRGGRQMNQIDYKQKYKKFMFPKGLIGQTSGTSKHSASQSENFSFKQQKYLIKLLVTGIVAILVLYQWELINSQKYFDFE
ncbi:cytosolic carboxypeptidase-like protein 5 [Stylonychia lemnae]|uniref:Cytosolic carboxypeptidase-like protein 5 n=1 Tax=Stylonychia lemnae TaxID=5949 RepID=A0A078BAC9_STYLE|nr:cytosolic carboxypeptidase-like protein 5 [Stylonychia lemnae]|eukprot:CDW91354.1 cytosolic carboxypeptidase-like protein 5 [Stylonychia lemnae]